MEHFMEAQDRKRPWLLLAEDDQTLRRILASAFRQEGYEVVEAHDGFELLDYLRCPPVRGGRTGEFDVIISDIRMPVLSGLDALACLRDSGAQTPMVLITAFGDAETHIEAHRLGASLVFDKPFDLEDLKAAIRKIKPPDSAT
jgi:DNA-binding response OmpR family regulator